MIKKILILPFVLIFSGCFSLKTPLPEVTYYDLDSHPIIKTRCKKSSRIGIAEIQSSSIYEKHEILLKKATGEISNVPSIAWVDSPKNLVKKFLLKQLNANCIKTSLPPFGGVRNDFLLKIELLNFEVVQQKGKEFVQISLFYELSSFKDFKILESGVLSGQEEVRGDYISAFSKAMMGVSKKMTKKLEKR